MKRDLRMIQLVFVALCSVVHTAAAAESPPEQNARDRFATKIPQAAVTVESAKGTSSGVGAGFVVVNGESGSACDLHLRKGGSAELTIRLADLDAETLVVAELPGEHLARLAHKSSHSVTVSTRDARASIDLQDLQSGVVSMSKTGNVLHLYLPTREAAEELASLLRDIVRKCAAPR